MTTATTTATLVLAPVSNSAVLSFIDEVKGGVMGNTLVTATIPTMNKRGNPFIGRVIKLTYTANVAEKCDYETMVNSRLSKEGKLADFISKAPSGRIWVKGKENILLEGVKNPDQKYLRVLWYKHTTTSVCYLVDGRKATPEEVEELKKFMPQKSTPNQGLEEGNEVIVRDYKVEGILYMGHKGNAFNATPYTLQEIKEFIQG